MKRALTFAIVTGVSLVVMPSAGAQGAGDPMRARLTSLIQARLDSKQVVHLSADEVTLNGDSLHLSGKARIRFDSTMIVADEAVIDQVARHVELIGQVNAYLPAPPGARAPRVEYR